jgi:hypothetical protein
MRPLLNGGTLACERANSLPSSLFRIDRPWGSGRGVWLAHTHLLVVDASPTAPELERRDWACSLRWVGSFCGRWRVGDDRSRHRIGAACLPCARRDWKRGLDASPQALVVNMRRSAELVRLNRCCEIVATALPSSGEGGEQMRVELLPAIATIRSVKAARTIVTVLSLRARSGRGGGRRGG